MLSYELIFVDMQRKPSSQEAESEAYTTVYGVNIKRMLLVEYENTELLNYGSKIDWSFRYMLANARFSMYNNGQMYANKNACVELHDMLTPLTSLWCSRE